MRFGLIGGAHNLRRAKAADYQRCVNLYPETVRSGQGRNQKILLGTPGITLFGTLTEGPIRGLFTSEVTGDIKTYAAGGTSVFQLDNNGVPTLLSGDKLADDQRNPAVFAENGVEIMIVSGGLGYTSDGTTVTQIADADFPAAVRQCVFIDGYFIVNPADTQDIYISALYDGTSWNALDFGAAESAPDDVLSIFADHRELWIFGSNTTEVFANTGDADFPFERISGAIMEVGIDATYSVGKAAGGLFWLGGTRDRGRGIVYKSQGFQHRRVSNFAVEQAIQSYSTTSDAVAFTYEEEGHEFYVLNFPTVGKCWVFDATEEEWHERGYWNGNSFEAPRQINHVFAFNKHLVGDRVNGKVYEQDLGVYSDDGDEIVRIRTSPHIAGEDNNYQFHSELVVVIESGVGLGGSVQGSDPQIMMRFSDDGGNTWSNRQQRPMGKLGEFGREVRFSRLGRSRSRIYELSVSDPVEVVIIDAYVKVSQGFA